MYFNFFLIDSTSNGLSPYILDILAIISILFGIFVIIVIAYLLVCVGAVSILFLFILMLINIRIYELLRVTSQIYTSRTKKITNIPLQSGIFEIWGLYGYLLVSVKNLTGIGIATGPVEDYTLTCLIISGLLFGSLLGYRRYNKVTKYKPNIEKDHVNNCYKYSIIDTNESIEFLIDEINKSARARARVHPSTPTIYCQYNWMNEIRSLLLILIYIIAISLFAVAIGVAFIVYIFFFCTRSFFF